MACFDHISILEPLKVVELVTLNCMTKQQKKDYDF